MNSSLLDVKQLSKQFPLQKKILHAVQDISLSLSCGEILGIGGESGCGKSTLGKLLSGFLIPTSGSIHFDGDDLTNIVKSRSWRRKIQMIFQHPAASLNPRMSVEQTLAEPFIIHHLASGKEHSLKVRHLLEQVGLSEEFLTRFPHELSGGQKQRIAIARGLALHPKLLILDEPFSALDVMLQFQIIQLLIQLWREQQLSYIVISHDLAMLRYFTHRIGIMYLGKLVELGLTSEISNQPLHPYTQSLFSAILPVDRSSNKTRRLILKGETPSAARHTQGCPFFSRCPFALPKCQTISPAWKEIKLRHYTACHLYS